MLDKCDESFRFVKTLCADLSKRTEFMNNPRAAEELKDLLRSAVKNNLTCASIKGWMKVKEDDSSSPSLQYYAMFDPLSYACLMTIAVEKLPVPIKQ